jgi:hypothetical protein
MTRLIDRVSRMELARSGNALSAHYVRQDRGQSIDEALNAHGRNRIKPGEMVVFEDAATAYRRMCNEPTREPSGPPDPRFARMTPAEIYRYVKFGEVK